MKKFILLFVVLLAIHACKKGADVVSLADRIKKAWVASSVKHNGTTVYTAGTSNNALPGYSSFALNLSTSTVTLTDLGGTATTGQWEVSADEKKLTLKGLNPIPDGTNGIVEYSIDNVTDTQLILTRTTTNAKTGGSVATYVLVIK